jgi:hypothetical protein
MKNKKSSSKNSYIKIAFDRDNFYLELAMIDESMMNDIYCFIEYTPAGKIIKTEIMDKVRLFRDVFLDSNSFGIEINEKFIF